MAVLTGSSNLIRRARSSFHRSPGHQPGQLAWGHFLAIGADRTLFVADVLNWRFQVLSPPRCLGSSLTMCRRSGSFMGSRPVTVTSSARPVAHEIARPASRRCGRWKSGRYRTEIADINAVWRGPALGCSNGQGVFPAACLSAAGGGLVALGLLSSSATADEMTVRNDLKWEAAHLLERGDVAEYDRRATELRRTRERTPAGIWKLSLFYKGPDNWPAERPDAPIWARIDTATATYLREHPDSPRPSSPMRTCW